MAWLFGSKKSNSKQDLFVKEEDGFNVVTRSPPEARTAPYPLYPTISPIPRPGQAPPYPPYPAYLPSHQQPAAQPTFPASSSTSQHPPHSLDSIPFKLCSSLDASSSPITKYQLNNIKKRLDEISEGINSGAFRYDFKLEKSILQEERLSFREH